MINEEIINYFFVNCDSRGIPNVKSKAVFIEPVWVFRKGNSEYPKTEKNTLDSFFA